MIGWRTILASVLTISFGILASTNWISFLDNPQAGAVAIATGIIMAIMRMITTTPVGVFPHPAEKENIVLKQSNEELKNKIASLSNT